MEIYMLSCVCKYKEAKAGSESSRIPLQPQPGKDEGNPPVQESCVRIAWINTIQGHS